MSSDESDNVDSLIGEIIKQAASFNPSRINKLLGASAIGGQQDDTTDDPVPELSDGEKAFHFLHFEVGDILTFKNTVTVGTPIASTDGGAQGDGTEAVGELETASDDANLGVAPTCCKENHYSPTGMNKLSDCLEFIDPICKVQSSIEGEIR